MSQYHHATVGFAMRGMRFSAWVSGGLIHRFYDATQQLRKNKPNQPLRERLVRRFLPLSWKDGPGHLAVTPQSFDQLAVQLLLEHLRRLERQHLAG